MRGHTARETRRAAWIGRASLACVALFGCRNSPEVPQASPEAPQALSEAPPPSARASASAELPQLAPLSGEWLEQLKDGEQQPVFVTPPLGAIAPSRLIVGVHGAGDRPEWSCGGWRLASQASSFVVCPQGSRMSGETFGWASAKQLAERVDASVRATKARYELYVAAPPFIFAGFSQGATLAEPFLLANAARFPIVILAEGGYATARNPGFGKAYFAAGGRRVVLVCGGAACFRSARDAQKGLEKAGLQVLVVGDDKAGHNLNERMQKALQAAWPEIAAPLPAG